MDYLPCQCNRFGHKIFISKCLLHIFPQISAKYCGKNILPPFKLNMSRAMRKHVLYHMQTTKAQISLRICSLISAFVFHCLDSVMFLVSALKISSLMLASVAEQDSLSLTWSKTLEDTFSHYEAHINYLLKFSLKSQNQHIRSQNSN